MNPTTGEITLVDPAGGRTAMPTAGEYFTCSCSYWYGHRSYQRCTRTSIDWNADHADRPRADRICQVEKAYVWA